MLKAILTLTIFITSIIVLGNQNDLNTPQKRFLHLTGEIKDVNNNLLADVKINSVMIKASNHQRTEAETNTAADGKYSIKVQQSGKMTIEFTKAGYLPYILAINITEENYLQLRIDGTPLKHEIKLSKKSTLMPVDIYNGSNINFNPTRRVFEATPFKRYLQSHQIKYGKGAKSTDKLIKNIRSTIEDQDMKAFLANVATHEEVKNVVSNTTNKENLEKWSIFFKVNEANEFKNRFENNQDVFNSIDSLIAEKYSVSTFDINEAASKIIDETFTHFVTYTLTLKNKKGDLKKFDFYFINTLNGWKTHRFITENYS